MSEEDQRIGFIGLGNMGLPMCLRLLGAGNPVTAYDLNPTALDQAVAAGAERAESACDVAGAADVLLTSLPQPPHVIAVMRDGGALAALRPGRRGSTSPPTAARLSRSSQPRRPKVSPWSTAR